MINIFKNTESGLKKVDDFSENSWIELVNPTAAEITLVSKVIGTSEHMIFKVLDAEENSHIEEDEHGTMVVVNVPYLIDHSHKNKYDTIPLGIFIPEGKYLLTVSLKKNKLFDSFKSQESFFEGDIEKRSLAMRILYKVSTLYLTYLNQLNSDIDRKEMELYHSTKNQELVSLLHIEKSLVYFVGALKANDVVFQKILKEPVFTLSLVDKKILKEAIVENSQGIEMANTYREILTSMTNTYGTIISNNLNDIMKFLAGITIVFSVPTMLASFMGMNVPLGGFSTHPLSFGIMLILALILSILIGIWLKKKDML